MKKQKTLDDLARLTATVEEFCAWIESFPPRRLRPRPWGLREVLAHLVFWHEHYTRQTGACLAKESRRLPEGRFSDINARAVARLGASDSAALVRRFRRTNRRLCALAAANDPRKIVFRIKTDSHPWKLSDLIPAAEAHIRNHLRKLIKEYPGR